MTRAREILEQAARLICAKGFEATSMQEIADACELTKAGLYHHVKTKEALLLAIMHYGMDLFEEQVLAKVEHIADPLTRLRATMARNLELVTGSSKEVTIILHEHQTLTGDAKAEINRRKKKYVTFLETSFAQAIAAGQVRSTIDPTLAAFSLLGVVLWTYKWYRPGGRLDAKQLADGAIDLFFQGVEAR